MRLIDEFRLRISQNPNDTANGRCIGFGKTDGGLPIWCCGAGRCTR